MPVGLAAKAVARRRGGDCAASEWSGRARARRIRHVRRLRRHWSRAPALWQLCGKRASYQFTRLARGTRALRGPAERHGRTSWYGHGNGAASGRVGGRHPVNRSPLDRHCGAARLEKGPGLARSATGAAPGHVAQEGVCKRWTLLILAFAHTDINERRFRPCR